MAMPRSVRVHPDNQAAVAIALKCNGFLTQGDLAAHLQIALSTVSNFFRGVNVSISKYEQICEALGLDNKQLLKPQDVTVNDRQSAELTLSALPVPLFALDDGWVGRELALAELVKQVDAGCRLLVLTGLAGVGKTALAEKLLVALHPAWITDSDRQILRLNFDRQDQSTDFASVAARLLEQCGQIISTEERGNSQQLMVRLARQLQTHRYFLVVDSLEFVLKGNEVEGWSQFEDEEYARFFHSILSASSFDSSIVLTTQELPAQILELSSRYQNFLYCQTLKGLSRPEQMALFVKTGLDVSSADGEYLERIGRAYEGHPLALRVIAGEVGSRPFFGNLTAYWKRYGQEIERVESALADAEAGQLASADDRWQLDRFTRALRSHIRSRLNVTFERLQRDAKYAYILLCETSVYRCPVPEDWWLSHLEDWDRNEQEQWEALEALRERFLVEELLVGDEFQLKQHNLIRSIALQELERLELKPSD